MSIAALIRSMSAAGASAEAIAIAVDALEAAEGRIASQKAAARDRKARQRAKQREADEAVSRDSHATVTGQDGDSHAQPSPPPSFPPEPPKPPTPTPECVSTHAREAAFERFWLAYPRKVGKGDAKRKYTAALAKIAGPDPPSVLLRALERVKATWTDAQFIPHPATWLNQGRWEDEPETPVIEIRARQANAERPDPKRLAREANYSRAFAGAQAAAARRHGG